MRKVGIVIALITAATLGSISFAGTASAQGTLPESPTCDVPDALAAGAAEQGPANDPGNGTGEPFVSTFDGLSKSCHESVLNDEIRLSALLCGFADGWAIQPTNDPLPVGSTVEGANNALAEQIPEGDANPLPIGFEACGTVDPGCEPNCPSPGPDGGGGGGGGDAAVQAASAGADGGLPRTGAELFAGAGFALMSLGALVRRFLS